MNTRDTVDLARLRRSRRLHRSRRQWRRRRWLRRLARHTVRSALGTLTLVLVLSAFTAGYLRYRSALEVGPQRPAPGVLLDQAATYQAAANTPPGVAEAPIVLAYHDITDRPGDSYDVTPEAFAEHLAMLRAAGYRSLTGDEFVAVLRGAPSPPRSVLITFDDGPQGLWTHADRILAGYDFHAVALVITGRLDNRAGPYYLSWPEVRRMAASGRWTFGSHTRDAHREVPVRSAGPAAAPRSELVNRRWSPQGREPLHMFQQRVDADLRGSIEDLLRHGLPRPRLFAYPFSEASQPGQDPQALRYVLGRVAKLFDAAFSSLSSSPEPVGARARTRSPLIIDRLAVNGALSAAELFDAMQRMRTIPVTAAAPLARDADWTLPDGQAAPVRISGTGLAVDSPGRYVTARYAGQATADWTGYQATVSVRGLAPGVTGTLTARVGSDQPVAVRVSVRQARVSVGLLRDGDPLARLKPGDTHTVTVTVLADRTVVTVDGSRVASIPVGPSTGDPVPDPMRDPVLARGGIGVAAFRADTASSFPFFAGLRVTPATG